jgi:hypothetical protein
MKNPNEDGAGLLSVTHEDDNNTTFISVSIKINSVLVKCTVEVF